MSHDHPAGHRTWIFPDGDLPPRVPYDLDLVNRETHGHESLVVLNPGDRPSRATLRIYFSDQDPWDVLLPEIPSRRVICFRIDEPIGSPPVIVPQGQYALRLRCSEPVIAQLGRMDVRQPNLAYYTVMGFPAG